MKYSSQQLLGQTPQVVWEGFAIPTQSSYGADKLAEELNRLDTERQKAEDSLGAQVEAKCKAINSNQSHLKKINELIDSQKKQGNGRYMTGLLNGLILARSVLDGTKPVYRDHQGGVELDKAERLKVLKGLDDMAEFIGRSHNVPASYAEACRILGVSEDGDVQAPKVSQSFEVVMLMTSPAQFRIVGPDTNLDFGTWDKTAREVCDRLNAQHTQNFKLFEANCEKSAFEERLGVRDQQARRLLDALEAAQGILAQYITPQSGIKPRAALTSLLVVLDDAFLITMMRNLRNWLGKNPDIYACDDTAGEAPVEFKAEFPKRCYLSGIGLGLNGQAEVQISEAMVKDATIYPHYNIDSPFDNLKGLTISVETNGSKLDIVGCVDSKEGRRLTVLVSK